jgi:hypothetical protein
MISYLDYIKRLDELEIKLYDFQKRISYFRLLNLKFEKNNQIGGNKNINNLYSSKLNNSSYNRYKATHLFNDFRFVTNYSSIDLKIEKLKNLLEEIDSNKKKNRLILFLKAVTQ